MVLESVLYVDKRKEYKAYREYNQQTLDLIEEAFPDCLLLMKEEDFLPPGTTAFEAMEHIEDAVRDNLASQEHLMALIRTIPDRVYTPNNNGPRDYFAQVDADVRMAHKLGHVTDLKTVILFAQSAFTQAHKGAAGDIRKVNKEYQAKVKDEIDTKTIYREFKKHYVAELKEMAVNDSFTGQAGKANHVAEMQRQKIAELEEQLSNLDNHTADITSAYLLWDTN